MTLSEIPGTLLRESREFVTFGTASFVSLFQLCDDKKPTVMVDGWNAWYFNDLKKLVCTGNSSHLEVSFVNDLE